MSARSVLRDKLLIFNQICKLSYIAHWRQVFERMWRYHLKSLNIVIFIIKERIFLMQRKDHIVAVARFEFASSGSYKVYFATLVFTKVKTETIHVNQFILQTIIHGSKQDQEPSSTSNYPWRTVQAVNLNAENQYKFAAVRLVCIYHGF